MNSHSFCRTVLLAFILSLLVLPAFSAAQEAHPPHWAYSGPEDPSHWGKLDPSYAACSLGRTQCCSKIMASTSSSSSDSFAHTCLEATVRFAAELGYEVTVVKDATADYADEFMRAALVTNLPNYASAIMSTGEVVGSISSLKTIGITAH